MTKYRLDSIDEIFTIYVGGDAPCNRHFSSIKDSKFFIPVVSNGKGEDAVRGYTDIPKIAPPVITISARGTIGHVGYYNNAIYPTVRLLCLKPKQDDSPLFMYYAAKSLHYPDSTTVIPQLTSPMIHQIRLPRPPVSSQNRIAQLLSLTDKVIHYNKSLARELSAIVSLIYNYWFVQFDFPDENGRPYKSSGGKMVYNDQLKKEIPEGWKVVKIEDITSVVLGGTPSRDKNTYWNGNINWLNSGEIANFPILDSEEKITYEGLNNSAAKLMPEKTIVISITGYIRVSILGASSCANQSVVGIIDDKYNVGSSYLLNTVTNLIPYFDSKQTGNSQKHINKNVVGGSLVMLPPRNVLSKFEEIASPILDLIFNSARESKHLASLRDWLLPMLISGQAKVNKQDQQTTLTT